MPVFCHAVLLVICALSALTTSRPAFTGNPYIIEQLVTYTTAPSAFRNPFASKSENYTYGPATTAATYFNFIVRDPDPLTNARAACSSRWSANATAPTTWQRCKNETSFMFRFLDWEGVDGFELDVKHAFKDPSVGQPPQDVVVTYAKGGIREPEDLSCEEGGRGLEKFCQLNEAREFPVYAAIA